MKIVYHAESAVDAQLVADILNGNDIFSQVRGAGMQGAVGEAPAMGNVKVWAHDEDYEQARLLIEEWESSTFVDENDEQLFSDEDVVSEEQKPQAKHSYYFIYQMTFIFLLILMIFGALITS